MILLHTMAISIRVLFILTFITGILYPIVITGFAVTFFSFSVERKFGDRGGKNEGFGVDRAEVYKKRILLA